MTTRELDNPLEADALHQVERVLRGRLRAHGMSVAFVERTVDDAIQKAWEEYLRACSRGEVIESPRGFVVNRGFLRAIDELRRETRRADGAALDAILDRRGTSEPSTDELAIAYVEAEELRQAMGLLSPEEQQMLSLHYFEELDAEASAAALYCSESTYRRRLKRTLKKLGRILGAPVPEPGSELAIEIGVVVWVGLRGAEVALSRGPLDQLLAAAESLHDRLAWMVERARYVAGRTGSGGGGERIVAVASSGPGKAVGTCLAACLLAVGGAELASVGGSGTPHHADRSAAPRHVAAARQAKHKPQLVTAPPVPVPPPAASSTKSSRSSSAANSSATERERAATASVRSQSLESAAPREETASEPAPEASAPSSNSEPTPNEVAGSQGLESLAP